ncbi:MAG: alanine:cation symporter family protein [Ruminococcaceae bacterium]|nr:alanine:cation symporter family protein [Oscillospiraceae bacterium]
MLERILVGVGAVLPISLFLCGLYFFWRCGAALCRHPKRVLRAVLLQDQTGTSPWRALSVALAGTLGVGNIAGVATAISFGGAGAVFWMLVAAFFAMPIKYAEIVLAQSTARRDAALCLHGGATYYIRKAFGGGTGRVLAVVFALLLLFSTFTLGTMLQAAAATQALAAAFAWPPLLVGGVMALLAAVVLWRGREWLLRVCGVLVPLLCAVFVLLCIAVLTVRRALIGEALRAILTGAFSLKSGLGGLFGTAVRYGVSRGLVSNEAGCGTAPIAHAAAEASSPAAQGLFGVVEVFVDTVLLCTLTALVILVSGVPLCDEGGMHLALAAFGAVLGDLARAILALSCLLFAFATVLCWSHYGVEALGYLTNGVGRRAPALLLLGVALATLWGAVAAPRTVWALTDLALGAMTLLNLAALLLSRGTVLAETKRFCQ